MKLYNNEITANKCIVGETYYLTGEYWDMSEGVCLKNTPIVFKGRDRKRLSSGSPMVGSYGQYVFLTNDKEEIEAKSKTVFFLKTYWIIMKMYLIEGEIKTNIKKLSYTKLKLLLLHLQEYLKNKKEKNKINVHTRTNTMCCYILS